MKVLVALSLLAVSTASFAVDRKISDILYFPKGGTVFGQTEGSLFKGNIENDSEGFDTQADLVGWGFEQSLGYSFTDNFAMNAEIGFQHIDFQYDVDSDFGSFEASGSQKGQTDPSVGARIRAFESDTILDIKARYQISTGDAEVDGSESSVKTGGSELDLGFDLGQYMDNKQFSIGAVYTKYFEATTDYKEDDEKVKDDEHNEYQLNAQYQIGLSDISFFNFAGAVSFEDSYEDNDEGETSAKTTYMLMGQFKQLLVADFMLSAGAEWNNIHQDSIDQYNIFRFFVSALYQF